MINKPSTEELLEGASNRFELIIAISKRARQLEEEKEILNKSKKENSKITVAAIEFKKGDVRIINEPE